MSNKDTTLTATTQEISKVSGVLDREPGAETKSALSYCVTISQPSA